MIHINPSINSNTKVANIIPVSFMILPFLMQKVITKHTDDITVNVNIYKVLPGTFTAFDKNSFASCILTVLSVTIHIKPEIKITAARDMTSIISCIVFILKFPILFILLPLRYIKSC